MNNYYVYIYYRLDINEPFYVGMGHGNRWKRINNRNNHFERIVNKYPVAVEIIKDNLTEKQAHDIECWLINELVFEYGYSIDIPNNRSNIKTNHLVNMTWGGEGCSGINPFENKTEEEMKEIKRKMSIANSGRKLSESHIKQISERMKGENNPSSKKVICITTGKIFNTINEGAEYYNCDNSAISKCCLSDWKTCGILNNEKLVWMYLEDYETKTNEEIKRRIEEGKKTELHYKNGEHPRSTKVICLNTNERFDTIKEGSEKYNITESNIVQCLTKKTKSAGKINGEPLVWMYLEDYKCSTEEQIKKIIKESEIADDRVICLNSKIIYESATKASKENNIGISTINKCCNGVSSFAGKLNGEPLVWMFYKEYKKLSEDDIELRIQISKKYDLRIICITTGEIFMSTSEAGRHYKIDASYISKCCKKNISAGKLKDGTPLYWKKMNTQIK